MIATTVRDFKGRVYQVKEHIEGLYTVLEDKDGSRIKLRPYGWDQIGFIKP